MALRPHLSMRLPLSVLQDRCPSRSQRGSAARAADAENSGSTSAALLPSGYYRIGQMAYLARYDREAMLLVLIEHGPERAQAPSTQCDDVGRGNISRVLFELIRIEQLSAKRYLWFTNRMRLARAHGNQRIRFPLERAHQRRERRCMRACHQHGEHRRGWRIGSPGSSPSLRKFPNLNGRSMSTGSCGRDRRSPCRVLPSVCRSKGASAASIIRRPTVLNSMDVRRIAPSRSPQRSSQSAVCPESNRPVRPR
jgi:hypothetical protein